jgi:hypothetical protein
MQQVINLTGKVSEVDKVHKSDVSKLIGEKECIAEALETSKKKVVEAEAQFDQMADLYKTVSVLKIQQNVNMPNPVCNLVSGQRGAAKENHLLQRIARPIAKAIGKVGEF